MENPTIHDCTSYFSLLQFTFQAVLSTDGRVSFATFIYGGVGNVFGSVGFNAGDRTRFSNIDSESLMEVNTYRIDGMKSYNYVNP